MNLIEALQEENRKGREFLEELDSLDEHGYGGPGVEASKLITRGLIEKTETAIGSGDVVEMVKAAAMNGIGE